MEKKTKEFIEEEDVLKEKEESINLYYSTISTILSKVKHQFGRKTFEVFRMYLLCDMSYEKLDEVMGLSDSKERIIKVIKWLNGKI